MKTKPLVVPKARPVDGDEYHREDGAVFVWFAAWIKKDTHEDERSQ